VKRPSIRISQPEAFVSHANAQLTPAGRLRLAQLVVDQKWPLRRAAERWNCSVTTAKRWADRYRAEGRAGLVDRSLRPASSPRRTPTRLERRVVGLRVSRRWGPARIAYRLGMAISTVHKILRRYGCPPLAWTDPGTGVRIKGARRQANRYVHDAPGDMVHVDVKKLGRIPDGGGWRAVGKTQGNKNTTKGRIGYDLIHTAIDDCSRLAYSEILRDERKETCAAFWLRANAFFNSHGITVERVLTDNGPGYRSNAWRDALGDITPKRTRPYRPQTNGKVERFNRTLIEEWAYVRVYSSNAERTAALDDWLHLYNHHRRHTALKGLTPIARVNDLPGHYS
jgi:transposase InsO family protein